MGTAGRPDAFSGVPEEPRTSSIGKQGFKEKTKGLFSMFGKAKVRLSICQNVSIADLIE